MRRPLAQPTSLPRRRCHGKVFFSGAYRTLKYRASGWWAMMAVVDCSGSSWYSSLRRHADAVGRQELHERRLVVEVGAGRVAEAVAAAR